MIWPPLLITFEGIDGSGKSTLARRLVDELVSRGLEPVSVREPGGTQLSERVRNLLLDPGAQIDPRAELLLFAAARAQLTSETIRPALEDGRIVVCDRFYDSTTAYQGIGRGIAEVGWLADFHMFTTGGLRPDRTYIIDVPLDVAHARRGRVPDRMEAAGDAFFERVREGYLELAVAEPARAHILDGTRPVEELHQLILEDLARLAGSRS